MMVKIGIIIDNIVNGAGTERAVSSLCNGLLSLYPGEYQITIISIFSRNEENAFFKLNPKISIQHLAKVNDFTFLTKFFWYKKLVTEIREITKENAFDLLLGTTYVHNILLPLIVKSTNTKSMGCEHVVYMYPPKVFQFIRKFVYPKLNVVIVLNEMEQKNFHFLKNTAVIPNCLPFENNKRSILTTKRIITAGRLTHEKGVDILIDIYENIYQQAPDWELNIFGDGEDFEALQLKIKQKGLQSYIKLCGAVKNISESYLQSSVFVLSSRSESFGIVIIEAMNHGLPVISFDCDGPKNIIEDGKSGFLIRQFDTKEFSEKLLLLINDEQKRMQMGEMALKASYQYKENKIIPIWNRQIQSLLENQ